MPVFLHGRLQTLTGLLESSNAALRAYAALDLNTAGIVAAHLDEVGLAYQALGMPDAENDALVLSGQLVSARRGWDPLALVRVTSHRREMERFVALRVLTQAADRLRREREEVEQRLSEARDLLTPILLYALQNNLLPKGRTEPDQAALERLWAALQKDPHTQTAARQLAMKVPSADVVVLMGDLLAALN